MATVVFETPTILDLRAITTFGINAKPNSTSPIGFFGTGLKYAIAVCLRMGCKVDIWIEGKHHKFTLEKNSYRDKQFEFIRMSYPKHRFLGETHIQLPFTTELGKTWELWQAFRELYSNTLDEGGNTWLSQTPVLNCPNRDKTYILVQGDVFAEEYFDVDKTFLPNASHNRTDSAPVEHFFASSKHIYYRGMRVFDLEYPSCVTYNILANTDLTEDRTAKYPFLLDSTIREYIANSTDEKLIKIALNASPGTYEYRFDFGDVYIPPSTLFTSYVRNHAKDIHNSTAFKYVKSYDLTVKEDLASKPLPTQFITILEEDRMTGMLDFLSDNREEIMRLINCGEFKTSLC